MVLMYTYLHARDDIIISAPIAIPVFIAFNEVCGIIFGPISKGHHVRRIILQVPLSEETIGKHHAIGDRGWLHNSLEYRPRETSRV